jgi:hypothetical protein
MAKDKTKFKYVDVAIPLENVQLCQLLEDQSKLTGITEGKLLVQWATLYLQGNSAGITPPALPQETEPIRRRDTGPLAAVPHTPVIADYSEPSEDDFDAFGDPD